jgi:excisionase family DNA binding protein
LKVREVAAQLRACTATVYRLCDEGQLRHIRMLHAIRVDPIDLAAFIDARRSRQ